MTFDSFDVVQDRTDTGSLKWDKYAGRDILPMWVADTDFRAPPAVIAAIQRRLEHGILGYTRPPASLLQAVVRYFQRELGLELDPDWIVWLPGLVPALSMACGCTGSKGDRVLTATPVYPPFLAVHHDHQRKLLPVPLAIDPSGRYELDWDSLATAGTDQACVFLFCNPHNPVGRVYSRSDVIKAAEFCAERGMLLCSDEIHCDLILDPCATPHVSAASLSPDLRRHTITLMAASKTYNIAGLACAFAVIPDPAVRLKFRRSAGKMLPEISPLSFAATEAAYADAEPWRQGLLAYLRRSYEMIQEALCDLAPSVRLTPSEATYLAWLDVRGLGLSDPVGFFERHGLGFSDGRDFGSPGFVRVNFGCPQSVLGEALKRLHAAVTIGVHKE